MAAENVEDPILVTGGCGFLGQYLANDLVMQGYRVVLFDVRDNRSLLDNHINSDNCKVITGDVLNFTELVDAIIKQEAKSIIHTPRLQNPARVLRPYHGLRLHLLGTIHAFEATRLLKRGRITFISSGAVYDPELKTCTEDSPFFLDMPMGLYACEKASCEMIGLKYAQMYGVDFVSARASGIYGPGGTAPHNMNILVTNAVQGKKTEFKKGGDHRFEFTYVKDIAQGVRRIHTAPRLKHRVYNVGTGQNHSLFVIAEKIKECIPTADISMGPGLLEGSRWVQRNPMDISRLKELGYMPEYDLEKGITNFIQSFGRDS
jgi:UDP-glucose 4-epimerase